MEAGLRTAIAGHTAAAARSIAVVARILIVGGGWRGLALARELHDEGHALRIVTRREQRRGEIEATGAECFVGDPNRLVTLRAALEHVTIACWLLATASVDGAEAVPAPAPAVAPAPAGGQAGVGAAQAVADLHGSRLAQFLQSLVDTTVRGAVYEAGGAAVPVETLRGGEDIFSAVTERNAIPARVLRSDPRQQAGWVQEARETVGALLAGALS